ncbi:MAG: YraN family protein, partial [Calditrichaeota bacterium]
MPSSNRKDSHHSKLKQGQKFEKLAGDFYVSEGFDILAYNYRAGKKEIDLIVQKESLIVFVEVKSATSKKYGHPSERVDERKIQNLSNAANQFIIEKN